MGRLRGWQPCDESGRTDLSNVAPLVFAGSALPNIILGQCLRRDVRLKPDPQKEVGPTERSRAPLLVGSALAEQLFCVRLKSDPQKEAGPTKREGRTEARQPPFLLPHHPMLLPPSTA